MRSSNTEKSTFLGMSSGLCEQGKESEGEWCSHIAGVPLPSKYKTYYVTRLKQSNPILVLTTIYQVQLNVYSVVLQRDGEWSSGREGTVIGARTAREEFCHASHGREEDGMGPLTLSMDRLASHCLKYVVQIPNWRK